MDGHFLDYEDGIVWMDNPYGVEGCLGGEPTIQLCREFLITIAKGGMYGPEP
ncbi:DSBA oxidoreductase [Pseudomonas ficuserectae]|nr:DSBA oxidoreductase [Pseudomonas ficuserectae]